MLALIARTRPYEPARWDPGGLVIVLRVRYHGAVRPAERREIAP